MVYIKTSFLLIICVLFIANAINKLRIYQLNGYKISICKNIRKIIIIDLIVTLSAFICFLIFASFANKIISYLFLICWMLINVLVLKIYERQKISVTKRLIRLIVTFAILVFSISILLDKYFYFALPFINILLYPLIIIANFINYPIERLIKLLYIRASIKKLKAKNLTVIAITGSAGKTSVKYILYQLLSIKYKVYASSGNFNTDWGAIRSIKQLLDEKIFIVEMGARHVHDIKKICKIVDPKIGIITNIEKQHLSTFKSIENIYNTKKELADYLYNKTMIFNDNNLYVRKMKKEYLGISIGILDFNVVIKDFDGEYQHFEFLYKAKRYSAKTKMLGLHNIENILLAIKCALYFGIDINRIVDKISKLQNIDHRFSIKKENDITIIDDSYNANIEGCMNALKFLQNFQGRKIVFTQGIVELAKEQREANVKLGMEISKVADIVVVLGINKESIKRGLIINGFNQDKIIEISAFNEINLVFNQIIKKGDVVLIQNDLTDNY